MAGRNVDLLAHLRSLEVELHQAATRGDPARLEALLHADFVEFGRSGTVYSRASMFVHLREEATPPVIVADQFVLRPLSPTLALLTYRSAQRMPAGELVGHTLRTSLWQQAGTGWQLSFHQGTATAPSV